MLGCGLDYCCRAEIETCARALFFSSIGLSVLFCSFYSLSCLFCPPGSPSQLRLRGESHDVYEVYDVTTL